MPVPGSMHTRRVPSALRDARLYSVLALSVLTALAACQPAPDSRTGRSIRYRGDDAMIAGPTAELSDSTAGDVMLTGRELRFTGASGGDYLGAGGRQTIGGRIHGALRAAGGTVRLVGTVDRNATIAAGSVNVDRLGIVGRNGYLAGQTVHVDGTVRGDLLVSGGKVVLNGPVAGDVEVAAGELFLGPGAAIAGRLQYRVPKDRLHVDPFSHVTGPVTELAAQPGKKTAYLFGTLWILGFLMVGTVIIVFTPRLFSEAADVVRTRPGRSIVVGLGGIIFIPVAILIAACTVIGLPLAFLTALIYVVLLYVGRIAAAIWLGRWALGDRARFGRRGTLLSFGVGGAVLLLIRLIPGVGVLVAGIATVIGVGALLLRGRALSTTQLA